MSAPTVSPRRAGRREWTALAILALPTLLLSLDNSVLYLALPELAADLRPSGTELLWITDSYGFMIAGFLVTMGTLGDRIGRRLCPRRLSLSAVGDHRPARHRNARQHRHRDLPRANRWHRHRRRCRTTLSPAAQAAFAAGLNAVAGICAVAVLGFAIMAALALRDTRSESNAAVTA